MEEKKYITSENWTYTCFSSAELQAFIHLGAEPSLKNHDQVDVFYLLTVMKNDEEELFQWQFELLHDAILSINQKYGQWELKDRSQSSGGCGTCDAH